MKKTLTFLIFIVSFMSLATMIVLAEYDVDQPTLVQVSSDFGQIGKTVDITISISNNPGVSSLSFDVLFDNNKLELTNILFNVSLGGQTGSSESMQSPVTIQWVNAFSNWHQDEIFATLTFQIRDDVENNTETEISITYDPDNIYNLKEENVAISISDGKITVIPLAGDINGDGKVNNKDITRLFQRLANWDVYVNDAVLDVNGDGKINNKDITRLMQYLANWDVEIFPEIVHVHSYNDWVSNGESTHKRVCTCGHEEIEAHVWDNGVVISEPSITEEGLKKYTCMICGEIKTEILLPITYNVEFYSDDELLDVQSVKHGFSATAPTEPVKDGYRFSHWDKILFNITQDTIIKAVFIKTYVVEFIDYNYSIISTQIIDKDGDAVLPADPNRKNYMFYGWEGNFKNINADTTIQATYSRVYTVTFVDAENHVLKVYDEVEKGSSFANLDNIPIVPHIEGYDGIWSNYFTNITENLEISPVYSVKKYRVTFKMPDGEIIKYIDENGIEHDCQEVEFGSFAVAPQSPSYYFVWESNGKQEYRAYSFKEWSKNFNEITEDVDVTANYSSDFNQPIIAVKYYDKNNNLSPSITLCNLSNCRLYGLSFEITYKTENTDGTYNFHVDDVTFNNAADWLKDGDKLRYDLLINNNAKELNFAWSHGLGVRFDTYGNFISGISISATGGAEAEVTEKFKLVEAKCSMIVSFDDGTTFQKLTPIIIYG